MAPMRSLMFAVLSLLLASCRSATVAVTAPPPLPDFAAAVPLCPASYCRPLHASLATSDRGICVVRADGRAFCWGDGVDMDEHEVPVAMDGLTDVVQVSMASPWRGVSEHCLLRRTGEVRCWGDHRYDRLAPPSSGNARAIPMSIAGLPPAVEVRAIGGVSCAIDESGALFCWTEKLPEPFIVSGTGPVAHLSNYGDCIVRRDGTVACASEPPRSPRRLEWSTVAGITNAVHVVDLFTFHCAFLASGDPVCWDTRDGTNPIPTPGLRGAVDFVGSPHDDDSGLLQPALVGYVLRRDGAVGWTDNARRADGTKVLDGLAGGVAIAGETSFACVLRAKDEVWCRGQRWVLGLSSRTGSPLTGDVDQPARVILPP